ncbi:MAG: DUF6291 domain-containing protein [Lachnospiraceae bacterium]|nr:DUF6291 domain-containing protein [Lachnospiraceae bacterium]MCX4298016.1 DUF6291 domain-containing protein [Lachnospiraceae bacterium]
MSATKTAREKGKSDFLIDMSILKTIEDFTMEQKGEVLTAISNFVLHDIEPDMKTITGMSAKFFTQTIEENNLKWLDKCEQSKAAIKKRWEQERNGQSQS